MLLLYQSATLLACTKLAGIGNGLNEGVIRLLYGAGLAKGQTVPESTVGYGVRAVCTYRILNKICKDKVNDERFCCRCVSL